MDRQNYKEDRRRKYCDGITSEYYIRTGLPYQEQIRLSEKQNQELRAEILADDIWKDTKNQKPHKKKGEKYRDPSAYKVIFC